MVMMMTTTPTNHSTRAVGALAHDPTTRRSGVKSLTPEAQFRAPWLIFWVAFAVRVLYMTLAHSYRMRPYDDHLQFGWEMGRIARALVTGYGYADPFRGHTGPTAWVGPLYPLLMALVFKVFGIYTLKAAWVVLALNSFFSALTARAVWETGARCFDLSVAKWSAWIWALYPAAMQYAVRWVWEMTLTTLLFSWVLVLSLRLCNVGEKQADQADADGGGLKPEYCWAAFGLLWGLIGLSNPTLLIFLPVNGLWILACGPDWHRGARGALLAALVFGLCLAPWVWRNWRVFGQFVPMRTNFGVELYLGNGPGSTGLLMEYDHPIQSVEQLDLYAKMGEIAYSKMRGREAMEAILANPGHFWADVLRRAYFFWAAVPHPTDDTRLVEYGRSLNFCFTSLCGWMGLGLVLRQRKPGAGLFAGAFLLVPLLYYLVTVHARFRHPLEPLITVLGVYLFQSAERRTRWRPRSGGGGPIDARPGS